MTTKNEKIVEDFAAMEHSRWSRWQEYLHSKCTKNSDGSLTIPANLVIHWGRQISTPYSQLSEPEKEADRREVRPYIEYAQRLATRLDAEKEKAVKAERKRIIAAIKEHRKQTMDTLVDCDDRRFLFREILGLPALTPPTNQ